MLLREIINSIESVAPRSAQEEWDNSGMQVGDTGREIHSVLLTTDITIDVVNEAIDLGCELIISHQRVVEMAIKHDIAIYSAHTNLDSVVGGINTRLADKLGIEEQRILVPSGTNESRGLGVLGILGSPRKYEDFIAHIREVLECTYVRYTRPRKEMIQTVALCGGSGAEFIENAIEQGADVYLTADCKYHEFQDADGRIGLIDIDHWYSERHAREIFADILKPLDLNVYISKNDKTPIQLWQKKN